MAQRVFQLLHGADDVETLAGAAGAVDHADTAGAQAQCFEDFLADADFLFGFGRQADANGVANSGPEHIAHADR